MTTNKTLVRKIAKENNIIKLQKLLDTGLDDMIVLFIDFTIADKIELTPIIEARIAELS